MALILGPGLAPTSRQRTAFSLIEVIVAVGIFAVGIVTVLGLFAPVIQSLRTNGDTEAAAIAAGLLNAHLRRQLIDFVAEKLKLSEDFQAEEVDSNYDSSVDDRVFFSNLAGDKIGLRNDPIWAGDDREKYFEFILIRNEELSPAANDATAPWLAFNIRVRWPMYLSTPNGTVRPGVSASGIVPPGRRQVLFLSGSVRR